MPRLPTRLVASLQCFARYADNPAISARQEIPVTILALSLERLIMQSEADLRVGAMVRLRLPVIGWRHVTITWLDDARAGCEILFPLLPHELRAAIDSAPVRRDAPPPRKGKPATAAMPQAAPVRTRAPSRSQRGGRSPQTPAFTMPAFTIPPSPIPDIRAIGRALIAAIAQTCAGAIPSAPSAA
jgi:hypothetical protein